MSNILQNCQHCGVALEADTNFCEECGRPVAASASAFPTATSNRALASTSTPAVILSPGLSQDPIVVQPSNLLSTPAKKSSTPVWLIIILVLGGLGALCFLSVFCNIMANLGN